MNSRAIDLALKKQRLLLRSAVLREEFAGHAEGIAPLLAAADHVRAGARWLRVHPEAVAIAALVIAIVRPRILWRWAKRSFAVWRLWRFARNSLLDRMSSSAFFSR